MKTMSGLDTMSWILLIVSLACAALAGCVQGTVYDGNRYPIKELEIQLTNEATGKVMTVFTDEIGKFRFFPVFNGQYNLTASRYSYDDLEMTFEKNMDLYVVKEAVMANRSTVVVHEFEPPSLEPMRALDPNLATRGFTVYLPPSYMVEPDRRYPTIYLLHGNTHDNLSYFAPYHPLGIGLNLQSLMDDLISRGVAQELVLVVPNGELPDTWIEGNWRGSFFVNSVHNGEFETFVAEDLIDCIENNTDHCLWDDGDEGYRVIPSGESRAINGMCMGVLGALNMVLHYPGKFAAVAANFGLASLNEFIFPFSEGVIPFMVRYFDDPEVQEFVDTRIGALYQAFDGEHFPDNEFPIELGPDGEVIMTMVEDSFDPQGPEVELWSSFFLRYDPYTYLSEHPETIAGLSFYLDCGDHDSLQLYENNMAFSALLEDLGLEPSLSLGPENRHFFELYPNMSHVGLESDDRVQKALAFLANHLSGDDL